MKNLRVYPMSAASGLACSLLVLALLSGSLLSGATTMVTLNASTSPAAGDPGLTNINVTGHGFPSGTIPPANVFVSLKPTTPGPPSANTKAIAVTVVSGTTERITFRIPKTLSVPSATSYQVSISGTTSTGNTFKSSNTAALTVNPILAITTLSPLPPGTVGVSYSQTLSAIGGSGSYTWSISAGALPGGLSLNSATGTISGLPTAAGAFNFTAKVTDSISGTAAMAFALTINPALMITTNSPLPQGTVNVNYSQTLMATGGSGTYTWAVSAGSLPAGLSLTAATGVISGTPTMAATANFTIQVTDTNSVTATKVFALTINAPVVITTTSPLPNGQVGVNYAQTLTATGGSGTYTWAVTAGSLPGGLSLAAATGVISGMPTTAATSNFTIQATDTNQATGSMAFALTVNPAATLLTVAPNSANAGLTLQVSLTGSFTHFVQGATQASFGAGISVGGGTAGQPGPVTVNSATSATALIAISVSAATGSQTVTVTTGAEQVSLANAFTINTAIPFITLDTTSPTTIPVGFSGFSDPNLIHGVEYNDTAFDMMAKTLKPGFIRYPGGLDSQAFEWETAHENATWFNQLKPNLNSNEIGGLTRATELGQAKGGVCFTSTPPGTCYSNFTQLTSYVGANALVCINGYTDVDTNSAGLMAGAAQTAGLNVIEWELGNEPYGYTAIFPTASSYATAQENPYYNNLVAAAPSATVGLFYQGQFSSFNGKNYAAWDNGMTSFTPQYWNAVSTHIYPITSATLTTSQEEQQLNAVLGFATTDYISSYLAPLVGGRPIFITEFNSDAYATLNFETYLYNGIFLAEYVARMSTSPSVKGVAVQALYLGNNYQQGIIRAVNDNETYLINKYKANPNFSTNTATDPNTPFTFYYSTSALALEVANLAINSSNAIWPTALNGTIPTVPTSAVQGYGGTPIPAVFAQGYQGTDGMHYLLITNKSNQSLPFAIEVNGTLLEQSVTVTAVSNASDTAANTAANQNNVVVTSTSSANPITIGPYSVTTVQW